MTPDNEPLPEDYYLKYDGPDEFVKGEPFSERISKGINMSDEDLIKKCDEWIFSLAKSGGQSWVLSIPVRFDKDPDMLFTELGQRLKRRTEENARLRKLIQKAFHEGYILEGSLNDYYEKTWEQFKKDNGL